MRDRIEIRKNLIPYSFDILLGAEWYNLEFLYNHTEDLYTVTLSKDEEVLVYGEPLMYGMPLFADMYESGKFPMLEIVPFDESQQETEITKSNFGETVFLTIKDGDEDES